MKLFEIPFRFQNGFCSIVPDSVYAFIIKTMQQCGILSVHNWVSVKKFSDTTHNKTIATVTFENYVNYISCLIQYFVQTLFSFPLCASESLIFLKFQIYHYFSLFLNIKMNCFWNWMMAKSRLLLNFLTKVGF